MIKRHVLGEEARLPTSGTSVEPRLGEKEKHSFLVNTNQRRILRVDRQKKDLGTREGKKIALPNGRKKVVPENPGAERKKNVSSKKGRERKRKRSVGKRSTRETRGGGNPRRDGEYAFEKSFGPRFWGNKKKPRKSCGGVSVEHRKVLSSAQR